MCNSENDSACEDEFKYDSPALQEAFIKNCTAPSNVTEAEDATEALEVSVTEAEDVIETLEEIAKAAENVPQAFCRKSKIYSKLQKKSNEIFGTNWLEMMIVVFDTVMLCLLLPLDWEVLSNT